MAVKIRLQRHGKKNFAFFHIVVADSRSPRDGKFIEQIGSYNPNTNPATIVLDGEKALAWLKVGAQPTLVARRILSYEGILLRKHLAEGVAKGALTEAQADAKFAAWKEERDKKIAAKKTQPRRPRLRRPPARPPRKLPPRPLPLPKRLPPRNPPRLRQNNAENWQGTEIQRDSGRARYELPGHSPRGY